MITTRGMIRVMDQAPVLVIDGDTVWHGRTRVRLRGFDAPEIFRAKCPIERHKGLIAAARLIDILGHGQPAFHARGRNLDRYKRTLAVLTVNGQDVAAIMIREGHAVPYRGRGPKHDWCSP